MKLVPIRYDTSVPTLGRESISAATAGSLATAKIAGAAQDFFTQAIHQYRSYQKNNATAELELELSEWKKQHANKEFYDSAEVSNLEGVRLTEDIVDAKGEIQTVPRHEIPAYEVQAQLYDRYAQSLIKSKSVGIDLSHDRGLWESRMTEVVNTQTARNQQRAIGMMRSATAKQVEQNFKNAMNAQNYTAARGVINSSEMDTMKRVGMLREVNEREERDGLDNTILRMDRAELEKGLIILSDEKSYDDEGGILRDRERLQYARSFRTAMNALDAKDRSASAAFTSRVNREAREMTKAYGTQYGHNIPPVSLQNMREKLVMLGEKGEATLHELDLAAATMVATRAFLAGSPTERTQAQKQLEEELAADPGNPAKILLFDKVQKANAEATREQNADPLQYAISNSIINTEALPTNPQGGVDFAQQNGWGRNRSLNRAAAQDTFHGKVPLLTNQEVKAITAQVEDMSSMEKMNFVTNVIDTFDVEEADEVFDQLSMEEESGAWAHIGTIKDANVRKNVLRGKEIREENKGIIKNITTDYLPGIVERIGGTSAYYNVNKRASAESAILDAYAYLANKDGEWGGDYDEERMDKAVSMATNGMMVINDIIVQRPNPSVSATKFEGWLDRLSPDYINQLGGVHRYQDEDVIDYIKDGRIRMVSHGTNEYFLVDTRGFSSEPLMTPDQTQVFTFKYNKDAPRVASRRRSQFRGYRGNR